MDKEFGTIDYVREETLYTKLGTNPSTGGFWENGWSITKITFIYTFFSQARAQARPVDGFLHAIAQRREITQGCAFWGSESCAPKLWGKTPQKLKFWGRE